MTTSEPTPEKMHDARTRRNENVPEVCEPENRGKFRFHDLEEPLNDEKAESIASDDHCRPGDPMSLTRHGDGSEELKEFLAASSADRAKENVLPGR